MFKKGQHVRCLSGDGATKVTIGKVYQALEDQKHGGNYAFITILDDTGKRKSLFANRFELANGPYRCCPDPTDQELADEYRRLIDAKIPVFKELERRGYKITVPGFNIKEGLQGKDYAISKTSKITL